ARIFINLERRSPPATFRLFGPRVVPTFNYFQTATVLGADGYLGAEDVAQVGRVLLEGAGYTPRRLENSLGDLVRRGHLTPAAAAEEGARIGRALVEERLAACANLVGPIRSIYRWEGAVEEAAEHLLLVKARAADMSPLEARVRALHGYSVPEVLALSVRAG